MSGSSGRDWPLASRTRPPDLARPRARPRVSLRVAFGADRSPRAREPEIGRDWAKLNGDEQKTSSATIRAINQLASGLRKLASLITNRPFISRRRDAETPTCSQLARHPSPIGCSRRAARSSALRAGSAMSVAPTGLVCWAQSLFRRDRLFSKTASQQTKGDPSRLLSLPLPLPFASISGGSIRTLIAQCLSLGPALTRLPRGLTWRQVDRLLACLSACLESRVYFSLLCVFGRRRRRRRHTSGTTYCIDISYRGAKVKLSSSVGSGKCKSRRRATTDHLARAIEWPTPNETRRRLEPTSERVDL